MHNQSLWREFFVTLELLQKQCLSCGRDLVAVMNEIRLSDGQGAPSRRQLYSQHRALSRALMDSELQCLRRKGQQTITRLQSLSKSISSSDASSMERRSAGEAVAIRQICKNNLQKSTKNPCEHITHRLNAVMAIFVEVDRAARRLEQLTEQRRERLREITRQQALEDEMNEVSGIKTKTNPFSLARTLGTTICNKPSDKWRKPDDEIELKIYFYATITLFMGEFFVRGQSSSAKMRRHSHRLNAMINNLIRFTLTIYV